MSDPDVSKVVRGGDASADAGPAVVAVVCASNDPVVLERFLITSLRRQTVPWELRVVDAGKEGFKSCAEALNAGAAETSAPWLLFVHQDVGFADERFLERAIEMMTRLPDVGIAGPVGSAEHPVRGKQRLLNRLETGDPPHMVELIPIDGPTEVQTLDEMMLFVPRGVFAQQRFDPVACPDWHLYGVDYCLSVRRLARKSYVLPLLVHHLSGGKLSAGYYHTLKRVVRKHRRAFRRISTTSEVWPTRVPTAALKPWHYVKVLVRNARNLLRR